jgi:hypothetical protein
MTINEDASTLRARAQLLRALAVELERTPAMTLERFAGPDTWRNPRAAACAHDLFADQSRLFHAADDLRWTAMQLERRAADVEYETVRLGAPDSP